MGTTKRVFFIINFFIITVFFTVILLFRPPILWFELFSDNWIIGSLSIDKNFTYMYDTSGVVYTSAGGIYMFMYKLLMSGLGLSPFFITFTNKVILLKIVNVIGLSAVLSVFLSFVNNHFSKYSYWLLLIGIIFSPCLVKYSGNLFYQFFAYLIPFFFSWIYYKKISFFKYGLLLYIFLFYKFSCNTEFFTNLIVACVLPAIYIDSIESGKSLVIRKNHIKILIICILAFLSSYLYLIFLGYNTFGSIQAALSANSGRFAIRSFLSVKSFSILKSDIIEVIKYFFRNPMLKVGPFFSFSEAGLISVMVFANLVYKKKYGIDKQVRSLFRVTMMALIVSMSWFILFPGHMRYHQHLDDAVFYLPVNFFIFILLGVYISKGLHKMHLSNNNLN